MRFEHCVSTYFRYGRITLPVADRYMMSSLVECGDYCYGEWKTYEHLIEPGATVLDVGANIGAMAIFFARHVGAAGRVVAFEPCPFTHGLLTENVRINGLANVELHRAIASTESGESQFIDPFVERIDRVNFGALSVHSNDARGYGRMVPTPKIALDDLALERCDFIKVDVEGHETAVIRGATGLLERHTPVVTVETGDDRQDLGWFDILSEAGYRTYVYIFRVVTAPNFKNRPIDDMPPAAAIQAVCIPPTMPVPPAVRRYAYRPLPDRDALVAFCRSMRRLPSE